MELIGFMVSVGLIIGFIMIVSRLGKIISHLENIVGKLYHINRVCKTYAENEFDEQPEPDEEQELWLEVKDCCNCGRESKLDLKERVNKEFKCPYCGTINKSD